MYRKLNCRLLTSARKWLPGGVLPAFILISSTLSSPQSVLAQQVNFLTLSSGNPPPLTNVNLTVANGGPGATGTGVPPEITNFSVSANLGDLSQVVNGAPAQVAVGLRVRGDLPYALVVSQLSFTVQNLSYRGRDLSGAQDKGSFIRMTAGTPAGVGTRGNPQGTSINGAFAGQGLALSQIATGQVNGAASTIVATGQSPIRQTEEPPGPVGGPAGGTGTGGTGTGGTGGTGAGGTTAGGATTATTNNRRDEPSGVDIPVFFWFPTGLALGPVEGSRPGMFTTNLQFGVFPRP